MDNIAPVNNTDANKPNEALLSNDPIEQVEKEFEAYSEKMIWSIFGVSSMIVIHSNTYGVADEIDIYADFKSNFSPMPLESDFSLNSNVGDALKRLIADLSFNGDISFAGDEVRIDTSDNDESQDISEKTEEQFLNISNKILTNFRGALLDVLNNRLSNAMKEHVL